MLLIENVVRTKEVSKIHMPTGHTSLISHHGNVKLNNNMKLENVLVVPAFKYNLLSVHKLAKDENYKVNFQLGFCIIQDIESSCVKGVEIDVNGLYYLINEDVKTLINKVHKIAVRSKKKVEKGMALNVVSQINIPTVLSDLPVLKKNVLLWHQRLRRSPLDKI